MKISYNWLKSLIDFDLTPAELAERLTLNGQAVEELHRLGAGLDGVVVGRATAIRPHPGADRLRLVSVDYGEGRSVEVVCGAPNAAEGGTYPLALEGAVLAGGFEIKRAKIRGVESCGMLCSERELGISEDASGLMELDGALAPGTPLAAALGREDWLLLLDLGANRGDMWSHLGAAREVQAFAGTKIVYPESKPVETDPPVEKLTSVEILDTEGCPRYLARVITEVKIGPSPRWLVERLEAVGQRSINNVVDVTNFILLELGQPLHSFDLDKLGGNRIVVRKAAAGEKITTLDDVVRMLGPAMTVIADETKPVAVAGIMGDKYSEVDQNTSRVLLECAYFDPATNRRTARALGMFTEASRRFERGVDYGLMPYTVDRAARLIAEFSGGKVARGAIDVYPKKIEQNRIRLRASRIERLLDVRLEEREIFRLLESLDFRIAKAGKGVFEVTVPACRSLDVTREVDLIEELARLYGYDRIPERAKLEISPEAPGGGNYIREMQIRARLAGMGFQEAMTTSFSGSDLVEKVYGDQLYDPVRVASPLSAEEDVLRPDLFMSLQACIRRNVNRRNHDLRLFEMGEAFARKPGEKGTGEVRRLALAATGAVGPVHWAGTGGNWDFFGLKGVFEALAEALRVKGLRYERDDHPRYSPAECAAILLDGGRIGHLGLVSHETGRLLDLPEKVYYLEVDLDPLAAAAGEAKYRELFPYPGIRRDMSILVDLEIPCRELVEEIRAASPLVEEVSVFDLYQGEHVPAGKRSLALSVLFQSRERTLTDQEAEAAFAGIVNRLVKKFGVQQR